MIRKALIVLSLMLTSACYFTIRDTHIPDAQMPMAGITTEKRVGITTTTVVNPDRSQAPKKLPPVSTPLRTQRHLRCPTPPKFSSGTLLTKSRESLTATPSRSDTMASSQASCLSVSIHQRPFTRKNRLKRSAKRLQRSLGTYCSVNPYTSASTVTEQTRMAGCSHISIAHPMDCS